MSQCIRGLLSTNILKSCFNCRAAHTCRPPLLTTTTTRNVETKEAVPARKMKWDKKTALQMKYTRKGQSPVKVRTGFLPTFPPPLKPFLRDEDEKALEERYQMFAFLLRNGAAIEYGLPTRPDGYLCVSKLLNYPLFRNMDIFKLQEVVNSGGKYHLHIKFDPRRQDGPWWIRCQMFKEEHYVLEPALLTNANGLAVYQTSLEEWESHISRTGIARFNADYIRLDPIVQNRNYIDTPTPESQVFIFLDVHLCILHGLRFFYQIHSSQRRTPTSPVLTRGDALGLIPPSLFSRVLLVEAKKKHLWGVDPLQAQREWAVEPDDLDEHGRRKTLLPLPPKRLHGFIDLYNKNSLDNRQTHPETIKEALETVHSDV